ncbi:sigma-70 family RNA polymerase sigma factor [Tumebacillus sp. ITR2]|uniref:Sigma-70 family RNA polymerase sigma factor n=1 Tax=Tumebacillus amylolyticus TaxID=2801339 RepID=A0ABS1J911_9BACL|nr:sigma-70 family RNA polymerase sigma factor [Tumebacillus amylolyticus]MBL0386762.1 sigma-70 family RNA polymerase sigma factor [Tumebacillus amylolyticus]
MIQFTDQEWQDWLEKLIAGDRNAFEIVYTNTCEDIYRIVSFLVTDRQDVADIVNEVYIRMWKSLHRYDATREFRFWLHGLAVHTVQDWKRKVWRRLRLIDRKKSLEVEEHVHTEDQVLQDETRQELVERVAQLSHKLRVVVILRYFQHYSLEQIAELLTIPLGTVKSRHHLALKQLRISFEEPSVPRKVESPHVY